jgi:hypothetical protein
VVFKILGEIPSSNQIPEEQIKNIRKLYRYWYFSLLNKGTGLILKSMDEGGGVGLVLHVCTPSYAGGISRQTVV